MRRFRRILVWTERRDGRDNALEQAVAVAREYGAHLTLAHAVEPPRRLLRAVYPQAQEFHAVLQGEWTSRLEEVATQLRAEGLEVSIRVLEGKPFLAFAREVLRGGHDLLVKPARGSSEGPLFDSTNMHLLRKCPSAVWLTSHEAPSTSSILALVDPDPEYAELNRTILQMASSLAALQSASLDVLHVWEASGEHLLANRINPSDLRGYIDETRARSSRELEQVIAEAGVSMSEERVHLLKGDVRKAAPEYVQEHRPGLVVMGTLCRTGIRGLLIGNTAETILSTLSCPVLTVKPPGFQSPIEIEHDED